MSVSASGPVVYEGASRALRVLQNSSILGSRPCCRTWTQDLKHRSTVACSAHVQQGGPQPHTTAHTLMPDGHCPPRGLHPNVGAACRCWNYLILRKPATQLKSPSGSQE